MRFFLFLTCLLLPQLASAQLFSNFEAGSYILAKFPITRSEGQLKLKSGDYLLVKTSSGEKLKLTPRDVASFRIGNQKYITTNVGFEVRVGLGSTYVDKSFVEMLDSGQVVLMRYQYYIGSPGGGSTEHELYLVRPSNSYRSPTPLPTNNFGGAGKKFTQALSPFVAQRPDLVQLLAEGQISTDNLLNFIHALNTGQPFK